MASQCRGGAAHRGLSLASALADLTMRRRDRALWYPAAKTLARFDPAVAASWARDWQHECGASALRRGVHSLIAVHGLVWPKKTCPGLEGTLATQRRCDPGAASGLGL